jgi:hypothetical protein
MTTHEQKDRNAEIVQRRLNGETTGALALEYGVTATRIAQLVRRHKEKARERPNVSRRKKAADAVRPRLRKGEHGLWYCGDAVLTRAGETPKAAYDLWMTAAIAAAQPQPRAKTAPAAEPLPPYTGPVTVVTGTRAAPRALVMPASMRFAMERAGLAQGRLITLSGT